MQPLLIVLLIITAAVFLYWLLVTTEGVFLGRRVVVWLYDITAHKYDRIKEFNPEDERYFITAPLLRVLREIEYPVVLDVATGSGRVPFNLLSEPVFRGTVIGVDPARKMLKQAWDKLSRLNSGEDSFTLIQNHAEPLPFAAGVFDAATCLESLEFFPSAKGALVEIHRVLKPGAFFMTSRRRGFTGKLFLNHYLTTTEFRKLMSEIGFEEIRIQLWELDYDMVTARKSLT